MARITVEDCLEHIDNRFQLVLIATKRARQLEQGKAAHIDWENDKPTVLALREIAETLVGPAILQERDSEAEEEGEGEVELEAGEFGEEEASAAAEGEQEAAPAGESESPDEGEPSGEGESSGEDASGDEEEKI